MTWGRESPLIFDSFFYKFAVKDQTPKLELNGKQVFKILIRIGNANISILNKSTTSIEFAFKPCVAFS